MGSAGTSKPSSGSLDLQNFPKSNQMSPILAKRASNLKKMVQKKRHHFLAQIFSYTVMSHIFFLFFRLEMTHLTHQISNFAITMIE